MRVIRYLLIALVCAGLVFCRQNSVVRAEGSTELKLSILPLQCVMEVVDDGVQVIRRVMPRECERVDISYSR